MENFGWGGIMTKDEFVFTENGIVIAWVDDDGKVRKTPMKDWFWRKLPITIGPPEGIDVSS
jgi:hypothetical protein